MDPYASQLDLYHKFREDEENNSDCQRTKQKRRPKGHRVTLNKLWSVLKTLNSNRKVCLEWMWNKKMKSAKPKDKGYGKLVTDEEKRWPT